MKCFRCDTELPDQAKFCWECGSRTKLICINCGTELPLCANYCMECGIKVEPVKYCSLCGSELPSGAYFCIECGTKVEEPEIDFDELMRIASLHRDEIEEQYLPDNLTIININSVESDDYEVADIFIGDEEILIKGIDEGTTKQRVSFLCKDDKNHIESLKVLQFKVKVDSDKNVYLSDFEWIERSKK